MTGGPPRGGGWWREATVYQVYLRSFQDSDGDGVGDLAGLRSRLDVLAQLGIDTLWLSPIHPSPDVDFGYDVADYDAVHPVLGDLDDFDALLADARARGMRVLLDGVFNHTSDQHGWFQQSVADPEGPFGDFYIWRDGSPSRPPNNWGSTFGGPAWTFHPQRGQWYLHLFAPQQPDLNWRNPAVVAAVLDSMEGWLRRGVSGFRLDVFNLYRKHPELPDNPTRVPLLGLVYAFAAQAHVHDRDQADLAEVLGQMRALADRHDAVLVGETLDERFTYDNAAQWVGPDRLHLAFHFRLLHSRWGARPFAAAIRAWMDDLGPERWPTWVVGNHDFKRTATRWGARADRLKLVALLQCGLRGTPFLYQGEELGLTDEKLPRGAILDPPGRRFWPLYVGRDGCRTPVPWTDAGGGGFTTGDPWLPVSSVPADGTAAAQWDDPHSLWRFYQQAFRLRRATPALLHGEQEGPDGRHRQVLSWTRTHGDDRVRVLLNLSDRSVRVPAPPGRVLLGTHGPPRREQDALLLRPVEGLILAEQPRTPSRS